MSLANHKRILPLSLLISLLFGFAAQSVTLPIHATVHRWEETQNKSSSLGQSSADCDLCQAFHKSGSAQTPNQDLPIAYVSVGMLVLSTPSIPFTRSFARAHARGPPAQLLS